MLNTTLEIARGLAALWVFVYHMRGGLEPGLFRRFADAGFLGVPAFFVISGYCMMASSRSTIARGRPTRDFLKRRLRRIFPPFWGSILVALALGVPASRQFSVADWLSLSTLTRGLFSTGPTHLPWAAVNAVYWSLAIEVQFYLVMSGALVLRKRFDAVLVAVTAAGFAFWWFGPVQPGLFLQYWPMFALGLALHTALDRGPRLFGPRASCALATVAVSVALGLAVFRPDEGLARQTLFAGLVAAGLWAAAGFESALPKAFQSLAPLGRMSYSVYLLHIHLASFVAVSLARLMPRAGHFPPLVYIGGALPLAWAFHLVCEKPFSSARRLRA